MLASQEHESLFKKTPPDKPREKPLLHFLNPENREFKMIPLYSNPDDDVDLMENTVLLSMFEAGQNPTDHFRQARQYLNQKQSWIIKRIMSLSKQFADRIASISEEKRIPIRSLLQIYLLMTRFNEHIEDVLKNPPMVYFQEIEIPAGTLPEERDKFVSDVWQKVYHLLVESFWVLIITGMVEFINIWFRLEEKNLEDNTLYLLHTAPYVAMEDRISNIKSIAELKKYVGDEFKEFIVFLEFFLNNTRQKIKTIVEKRINLVKPPSKFRIDPFMEGTSLMQETDVKRENRLEKAFPLDESKHIKSDSEEDSKFSDSEKISFADEIILLFIEKMRKGLLPKYRLQGHPANLIKYISRLFDNISFTIVDRYWNETQKAENLVSSRTLRRWQKEAKEGNLPVTMDPDHPGVFREMRFFSEDEIDEIRKYNERKRRHETQHYLTQNQLIEALRSDRIMKRYGQQSLKYSPLTLRRKISKLIALNKIEVTKTAAAYLYKKEDIPSIARAIPELSSK